MKLWKKLMPVATVAATTACVVPMVTSCASSFMSTTDLDYKGLEHAEAQFENNNAVIDEYFKNPKYFAADALVYMAEEGKEIKEYMLEDCKEGASYNFKGDVASLKIGEAKTIKISGQDVYGYTFSAKINLTVSFEGELKSVTSPITKSTIKGTATMQYEMTNCCATLVKENDEWVAYLGAYTAASDSWSYLINYVVSASQENTYKDGKVLKIDISDLEDPQYKSAKNGNDDAELLELDAPSFAKVTTK